MCPTGDYINAFRGPSGVRSACRVRLYQPDEKDEAIGDAPVAIISELVANPGTSVTMRDAYGSFSEVDTSCGSSLEGEARCSITVTFTPKSIAESGRSSKGELVGDGGGVSFPE